MKKLLAAALLLSATTAAQAQHECDKVLRVDRISSNGTAGHFTYELIVSNLIGNTVRFHMEGGGFPKGVNVPSSKSATIAPRGNLHIAYGSGNVSLDGVKKEFFYDRRHSLPQGYVLLTDCLQASAR